MGVSSLFFCVFVYRFVEGRVLVWGFRVVGG